jgi:glycerol-1-phosphate dehydrogenase [NAD(P)+]
MLQDLLKTESCVCGRDHTLSTKDFIIEENAYRHLPSLLKKSDIKGVVLAVYDANTWEAAHDGIDAYLPDVKTHILKGEHIHANEERVDEILNAISALSPGILLAVGGGVVCDIVRYATFKAGLPFIAVPTSASVDGFVSSSAAMTFGGTKVSIETRAPIAVAADLSIIAAAPGKLAASGVGDMLSKFISIADWKIGHLISGEYYCPFIADFELQAIQDITDAIPDIKKGGIDGTRKLVEGLLISGLAMQMAKITRPASSFEHHFSHYLEVVPVPGVNKEALHGEKVGVGTVIAAKYYPIFADSLQKIFRENLKNKFDMEKVKSYYSKYSKSLTDRVVAENTPTCTDALNPQLLEKNWSQVSDIAHSLPTSKQMTTWLSDLNGYCDYRQLGLTSESCLEALKVCCYIRNRFTMLRIVRDYETYTIDSLLV